MNLKLGVSIYSVPEHSVDALLDFVEKNNFDGIELWDSPLPKGSTKLSKYLGSESRVLSVHAPMLDLGNEGNIKSNIQALRETIERAGEYGAKIVVLHTGMLIDIDVCRGFEVAKRVIESNLDLLEEYGIILCLENVGYLGNELISDFDQLVSLVDCFPVHLVGVAFDISHANVTRNVEAGIEILGNRIKHIHVSDNNGKQTNHHKPIGKGNIDFRLLEKCSIIDNSMIILEIVPDDIWQTNLLSGRRFLQELNILSK